MNVEGNTYEEYKRNLSAAEKTRSGRHTAKVMLITGISLLLLVLVSIPFHATQIQSITGDEMKAGATYRVDRLYILDTRVNENDDQMYCVAEFFDKNNEAWLLSFTPGEKDTIRQQIERDKKLGQDRECTVAGYVTIEKLSDKARAYYSSRSKQYKDSLGEEKLLWLNADYLCETTTIRSRRSCGRDIQEQVSFLES